MVKKDNETIRKQRNVFFTDDEWGRLLKVAKAVGFDDRSAFIRYNMMNIVREEESQK